MGMSHEVLVNTTLQDSHHGLVITLHRPQVLGDKVLYAVLKQFSVEPAIPRSYDPGSYLSTTGEREVSGLHLHLQTRPTVDVAAVVQPLLLLL